VPGFLEALDALKEKGIDKIAVTSANDVFVMAYWAEHLGATDKIEMLADGNAAFAALIGMEQDLSAKQMGVRSRRYAMIIRDGIVKYVGIDDGELDKSSVEAVMKQLH